MVDVGRLIRCCGAPAGRAHFLHSALYAELQQEAPYTAASLLGQFDDPRAEDAVVRLERMPNDAPTRDAAAWTSLRVPTLVVATRADLTHPFAYAEELAWAIPAARLVEITSKAVDKAHHVQEGRAVIATFLADLCRQL